jgi:hypothetical protein
MYLFSQVHQDSTFNSIIRQENGGWIAGDATFSIALPGQKTLWLFGDSFIGTVNENNAINPGSSFIHNCAVLQNSDSTTTAIYGGTFAQPSAFVSPPGNDSSWFWPEHGLLENDTLKIFLSEFILAPGPAGFNFKYNSTYLGLFSYPGFELLDLKQLPYYALNGVCYGNQVLSENGYTYIYGRQEVDTVYHINYPHVARAQSGFLAGPWEFYNGTDWVNDPSETQRISTEAVSQEYGVCKINNKYVLINQEIWFSTKIHSFTADLPQGPWKNKKLIYTTPLLFPNTFTYNAFPHPQFTSNDELLISYNSNGNFWDIFTNVEIYRPRFIRVPLQLIDTTLTTGLIEIQKTTIPEKVILFQNYPNPASDKTKISFTVTKTCFVNLRVNDIQGKVLNSYFNNTLVPGNYDVELNLQKFKPGVYSYCIGKSCFKFIKSP